MEKARPQERGGAPRRGEREGAQEGEQARVHDAHGAHVLRVVLALKAANRLVVRRVPLHVAAVIPAELVALDLEHVQRELRGHALPQHVGDDDLKRRGTAQT